MFRFPQLFSYWKSLEFGYNVWMCHMETAEFIPAEIHDRMCVLFRTVSGWLLAFHFHLFKFTNFINVSSLHGNQSNLLIHVPRPSAKKGQSNTLKESLTIIKPLRGTASNIWLLTIVSVRKLGSQRSLCLTKCCSTYRWAALREGFWEVICACSR